MLQVPEVMSCSFEILKLISKLLAWLDLVHIVLPSPALFMQDLFSLLCRNSSFTIFFKMIKHRLYTIIKIVMRQVQLFLEHLELFLLVT